MFYLKKINTIKKKILEKNFFRPSWYSVFLNPYFINRNAIYKNMIKFSRESNNENKILDIGCGIKPYRSLFKTINYIGIDIKNSGHSNTDKIVDKFYDGENIPYEDNSFDFIVCTQVLEHTKNPEKIYKECSRVLKNNGKIFISMPFVYPEHEVPFDFQRYSKYKHQLLIKENNLTMIKITKTTGFFGTFGQLFVIFMFESIKMRASIIKTILSILIFGPIQIINLFLDFVFKKAGPTIDYIIIAQKNGN